MLRTNLTVYIAKTDSLQTPTDRCDSTENGCNEMMTGIHLNRINESGQPSADKEDYNAQG